MRVESVDHDSSSRLKIGVVQGVLGVVLVAAITFLCRRVPGVNSSTAGFAYLLAILWIATSWGLSEAIAASVVAMLCFNFYFLPPVGQFTIADPQNWVALLAFLITALAASHLSDQAKQKATEASRRQRETEQLYALSRAVLLSQSDRSLGLQVARAIAQVYGCEAVALYDAATGVVHSGGEKELPDLLVQLKQAVTQGRNWQEQDGRLTIAAVTLGGKPIGSLALLGPGLSEGALQALLNLMAIAIERVRTQESANRAEVARQSEEFKSTLLDAIAHEFKTPLTSIKAASTSILSDAGALPAGTAELATIIDEETDRLSLLVTEAVRMAQIEAGQLRLQLRPVNLWSLCHAVLAHFAQRLEGRRIDISVSTNLIRPRADFELLSLALRQLVDNALKYSPADTPLELASELRSGSVALLVRDHGPGIPEVDAQRIFDKFYRRSPSKHGVPGSGLGLHIAREIVRAHGGELTVESAPGGGSVFRIELPVGGEESEA